MKLKEYFLILFVMEILYIFITNILKISLVCGNFTYTLMYRYSIDNRHKQLRLLVRAVFDKHTT